MSSTSIYVAASYKHMHAVHLLHLALRFNVPTIKILDWTEKSMPPSGLTPIERRQWFDTDQKGGQVYTFCRDASTNADLLIYLGASGQDAGVEVGMASAAGIPILGLRGPLEAPGLMLHGAVDMWVTTPEEVVLTVRDVVACTKQIAPDRCYGYNCSLKIICPHFRAELMDVIAFERNLRAAKLASKHEEETHAY